MNISEANGRDYFWQKDWQVGYPSWLVRLSFVDEDSVIAKSGPSNGSVSSPDTLRALSTADLTASFLPAWKIIYILKNKLR